MSDWQDYLSSKNEDEHTVRGKLMVLEDLKSPQLGNKRDILVHLPPSYGNGRRFPVIYMHDGQNLFDASTSFAGEWRVDETMETLDQEGIEAIIVGIPNTGKNRLNEYSPFIETGLGGGRGDDYLRFIVQTIKPIIDADYCTRPDRENTGIMGSSMGGLISLYALFRHPQTFGFDSARSPAFWFARGAIYNYVRKADFQPGNIYLDAGTREYGDTRGRMRNLSRRYCASIRRMQRLLVRKGYRPRRELLFVEDRWARHEEEAWARRYPYAIRFLFSNSKPFKRASFKRLFSSSPF
jgi:predicted alpha/beta superfamily hydrolase